MTPERRTILAAANSVATEAEFLVAAISIDSPNLTARAKSLLRKIERLENACAVIELANEPSGI